MFAAVGTHPVLYRRIKPMIVVGFLALSLMVGAITAPRVGAEPVQRGLDGFSNACADLQDQAQNLVNQYNATGSANPNDSALDDLLAQLRSVGTTWQQIGCQGVYGNILRQAPAPSGITATVGLVSAIFRSASSPSRVLAVTVIPLLPR